MIKHLLMILLFSPFMVHALDMDPWFHDFWQIYFTPSHTYSYYPSIEGSVNSKPYSSHNQLFQCDLGVSFLPNWDGQIEAQFSSTRNSDWGSRSTAMQVRYLVLDDVAGAPISLTVGGNIRFVPNRSLRDPSCPYHSSFNMELGAGIGKEIDRVFNWLYRIYGYVGVGVVNNGASWLRSMTSFGFNYRNRHHWTVFTEGYFGFGEMDWVNVRTFHGYSKVHHQSMDLGGAYQYLFKIWGSFRLECLFRVYARNYPQYESKFEVRYSLPFSIF